VLYDQKYNVSVQELPIQPILVQKSIVNRGIEFELKDGRFRSDRLGELEVVVRCI
jgi:hypothetical protein